MMKAKIYDRIKTSVDVQAEFSARVIFKGTLGTVVECYEHPEGYAVDIAIPNKIMVGGFEYENVILNSDHFAVVDNTLKILEISSKENIFEFVDKS